MFTARRVGMLYLFGAALGTLSASAVPLSTGFTYQGRLDDGGSPASGSYDIRFSLFDASAGPAQVGASICFDNVTVTDGVFTVQLNSAGEFGPTAFNGQARWLQIEVRQDNTAGNCAAGAYTTLAPRQPLTAAPYALFAAAPWITSGANLSYSAGNVGIGDTTPAATLTVGNGDKLQISGAEGDVTFTDDLGSITFPATDATNSPMIQMFASGTTNGDRMVIAHGPANPLWGLQYQDSTDQFHFRSASTIQASFNLSSGHVGIGRTTPVGSERFTVDGLSRFETGGVIIDGPFSGSGRGLTVYCITSGDGVNIQNDGTGNSLRVNGDAAISSGNLRFLDDSASIVFPVADATNNPMIEMFASGASNGNRMVIAHSPSFSNWGLQYRDTTDQFAFLGSGSPAVTIDLNGPDAEPGSGGFLVIGDTAGGNVAIDNNEIMARNNGAVSTLYLNNDGGDVIIAPNYTTQVGVLEITGGADLSERFEVNGDSVEPGMVVVIDPARPGELKPACQAYDRKVAGVVSGAGGVKPGMTLSQPGTVADGKLPVALTGRVYVLCDAGSGAIEPGDMLTTSTVCGHAMKATDAGRSTGAILGKAMTPLAAGERGLVLVLVNLQ